jgi:disulfide oxidoreductase YuzD
MPSEAELKLEIFRLLDSQHEEDLKEIYDWLSIKVGKKNNLSDLEKGYRDMAADTDREKDAMEWIEGTLNSDEL